MANAQPELSPVDIVLSGLAPHLNVTYCIQPPKKLVGGGGCGDIYQAELVRQGTEGRGDILEFIIVAIKTIRAHYRHDRVFARAFLKELYIWAKFNHPNIVKLEGYMLEDAFPSIVLEWADNGTIMQYIKLNPSIDRVEIIRGISRGLLYLHQLDAIHSDLKGDNILVNKDGQPMLTDFGTTRLLQYTKAAMRTTTTRDPNRSTTRWLAYELFDFPPSNIQKNEDSSSDDESSDSKDSEDSAGEEELSPGRPDVTSFSEMTDEDEDTIVKHTKMSDMWAFGMVVYEVLTVDIPYRELKTDAQVIKAIMDKGIPSRPENMCTSAKALWKLSKRCWDHSLEKRLTIQEAIFTLSQINAPMKQKRRTSTKNCARDPSTATSKSPTDNTSTINGTEISQADTVLDARDFFDVQTSSTRQGPGLNLKEAVKSLTFSDMSSGTGGYKRRRACNRCAMARTRCDRSSPLLNGPCTSCIRRGVECLTTGEPEMASLTS